MLVHSVYFWLKDGLSDSERELFASKLNALKQIPAAMGVYVGTPASTDRAVIDRSYDFALTVLFENMDAHDEYQKDPIHQEFIEKCAPMFGRIVVYDAD